MVMSEGIRDVFEFKKMQGIKIYHTQNVAKTRKEIQALHVFKLVSIIFK